MHDSQSRNDVYVTIPESLAMSTDLKVILLKGIEETFHQECNETVESLEHIKSLLINIANTGSWRLPITIRGTEVQHPEYEKYLSLLEKCSLVKSRVKYTEHSSYRIYEISDSGATLVRRLNGDH